MMPRKASASQNRNDRGRRLSLRRVVERRLNNTGLESNVWRKVFCFGIGRVVLHVLSADAVGNTVVRDHFPLGIQLQDLTDQKSLMPTVISIKKNSLSNHSKLILSHRLRPKQRKEKSKKIND